MYIHMKQKWEYFEFAIEFEKTNEHQREKGKKEFIHSSLIISHR